MKSLLSALLVTSGLLLCRSPSCGAQQEHTRKWHPVPCTRTNFMAAAAPTKCFEKSPPQKLANGCIHREFAAVWRAPGGAAREYIFVIDNGNKFDTCLIHGHVFSADVTRYIATVLKHAISNVFHSHVDLATALTEDGTHANWRRVELADTRRACVAFMKNGTPGVPKHLADDKGINRTSIMTGIYCAEPGAGPAVDNDVGGFIDSIKIE